MASISDTMGLESLRLCLAACIKRAEREAGGCSDSDNDFYWHTREAAVEVFRKRGGGTADLIGTAQRISEMTEDLDALTEPMWPEVMHPEWLCRDVLES